MVVRERRRCDARCDHAVGSYRYPGAHGNRGTVERIPLCSRPAHGDCLPWDEARRVGWASCLSLDCASGEIRRHRRTDHRPSRDAPVSTRRGVEQAAPGGTDRTRTSKAGGVVVVRVITCPTYPTYPTYPTDPTDSTDSTYPTYETYRKNEAVTLA